MLSPGYPNGFDDYYRYDSPLDYSTSKKTSGHYATASKSGPPGVWVAKTSTDASHASASASASAETTTTNGGRWNKNTSFPTETHSAADHELDLKFDPWEYWGHRVDTPEADPLDDDPWAEMVAQNNEQAAMKEADRVERKNSAKMMLKNEAPAGISSGSSSSKEQEKPVSSSSSGRQQVPPSKTLSGPSSGATNPFADVWYPSEGGLPPARDHTTTPRLKSKGAVDASRPKFLEEALRRGSSADLSEQDEEMRKRQLEWIEKSRQEFATALNSIQQQQMGTAATTSGV